MIGITGSTGHLGQLTIAHLIKLGVSPKNIVAFARDHQKAESLSKLGVEVRLVNYDSEESFVKALSNVENLLLISSSEPGKRVYQHRNVIEAAKKSGVKFLAYTSVLNSTSNKMMLASDHVQTEKLLAESGLNYAILRNGWYIENYSEQIQNFIRAGSMFGAAGDGKISIAPRSDYALAAARIVKDPTATTANKKIFELGGSVVTLTELAKLFSAKYKQEIKYTNMSESSFKEHLQNIGLPEQLAVILADCDIGISRDELYTSSADLLDLLKREPISVKKFLEDSVPRAPID